MNKEKPKVTISKLAKGDIRINVSSSINFCADYQSMKTDVGMSMEVSPQKRKTAVRLLIEEVDAELASRLPEMKDTVQELARIKDAM